MKTENILGFTLTFIKDKIIINAGSEDITELDKIVRERYDIKSFSCTKENQPEFPNIVSYVLN